MHRELKLQHALLQQVAQKVGVTEEATAEMRKLVEEAPEGAPVAALLRTPPLTRDKTSAELTINTAEAKEPESSTDLVEKEGDHAV
jgi:hypothetical protein